MAIVRGIPEGFHSLTPSLICRETPKAMEFYARAFGANFLNKPFSGKELAAAVEKVMKGPAIS